MCNPVAIVMVASAMYSANEQRKQGKFQNETAKYNTRVAENEAQKTRDVGTERENIQRRKTAELISKQKAQLGAANIDLTSGSALQLQEDTAALGEADALRIRSNFENRALSLETGAVLTEAQGEFAESAGKSGAAGTLLSGVAGAAASTGVADSWFTPDSAAMAGSPAIDYNLGVA